MITIADDETVRIVIDGKESNAVTLVFSSLGRPNLGLEGQGPEFAPLRATATTIFIMDRRRSWGNDLDFERLTSVIAPHTRGKTVNTLGASMGGFLAILMSRFIAVGSAVAFVPQYTIDEAGLVLRPRSIPYVRRIARLRYPSLAGAFGPSTAYFAFFGDCPIDRQHFDRFPRAANVANFRVGQPSVQHFLAQRLRNDGVLYPLIRDCFAGKPAAAIHRENFPPSYEVDLD
jgi:hypothetical protein